jgi:8-oxo-dGTP pyrophosphatase MutT (NUDIX family)
MYTLARVEYRRDDLDRTGEEYNAGEPTTPRQAASVIVLRGGDQGLEVLLVKRNPQARFMGGAWVFPGGAVDAGEAGDGDAAHRAAALRELAEEASLTVTDPDALVPFSRWITPAQVRIRFDTRFFLTPAPDDADARPDGEETVDARWFTPQGALDAHRAGEILLVFPTIKHLEQIGGFDSARALLDHARGREVRPVEPRVLVSGETARIVLPGEPGYEDPDTLGSP